MHATRALGIAFLFGLAGSAHAATPQVAGKYSYLGYHICQTVIHTPKKNFKLSNAGNSDAVTSVELDWNAGTEQNPAGMISVTVGTATFPSTPSSSGNVTMTTVEVLGHSMRDDNPANSGSGFARNPPTGISNGSATFTVMNATTLKVDNDLYDISVGNVVQGVARSINMVRRPKANEYCVDASTLTKQ